jgi:hypothetical protein
MTLWLYGLEYSNYGAVLVEDKGLAKDPLKAATHKLLVTVRAVGL